jgi:2-phospho-L-lactate transferase/gluconeogenesis factor (CofD/UPF0052 family)
MKQLKVVLIGGGTGLSVLARGLRERIGSASLSAAMTFLISPGAGIDISSLILPVLPPSSATVTIAVISIAALSDAEPILEELFQYRFEEHQIEGHSLGNLLPSLILPVLPPSSATVTIAVISIGYSRNPLASTESPVPPPISTTFN